MLTPVPVVLQIFVVLLVTLAAVSDLRTRRVPNALVLAFAVIGFVSQIFLFGIEGFRSAGSGFGSGFLLYFPLWLLHARGAGDVKLLAAAGAFLGPRNTVVLFIVAALIGGVLAVVLVLLKGRVRETASNIAMILADLFRFRRPAAGIHDPGALRLPHAPVIALATFAILAYISQTHWPSR